MKFNSDDHSIYYCGQESLRKGVAIMVNKSPRCSTWMQSEKRQNDLCCLQGKPFSITIIQIYAPTSNAEEAEVKQFYEDLHPQKRCPFQYRGLECKSRNSRNIWSNRQVWPWNTKWSRAKAHIVWPRENTGHSKHPRPTTQEKTLHMEITRWSTPK